MYIYIYIYTHIHTHIMYSRKLEHRIPKQHSGIALYLAHVGYRIPGNIIRFSCDLWQETGVKDS